MLLRMVEVLSKAVAPVRVSPVVVPDISESDPRPQLPAVTWARISGDQVPLLDGESVERPQVAMTTWAPTFKEGEDLRVQCVDALIEAGVLVQRPDPPEDRYEVGIVTETGLKEGNGAFSTTTYLTLQAD